MVQDTNNTAGVITAIETGIEGATDVLFKTSTTIEELKAQLILVSNDGESVETIESEDTTKNWLLSIKNLK